MKEVEISIKNRAYYDAKGSYFERLKQEYLQNTRWKINRIRNVLGLAQPGPGEVILDLGCGIGTFVFESAHLGAQPVGTDFSITALLTARQVASSQGVSAGCFVASDAGTLPFKKESFTLIICADLVEHLYEETYQRMLAECHRILIPGGRLAIYTPSPTHLFEWLQQQRIFYGEHSRTILPKDESHIGLKTMPYLLQTLQNQHFVIQRHYFRPTHLPVYRLLESLLIPVPGLGRLFRRRCCILAVK